MCDSSRSLRTLQGLDDRHRADDTCTQPVKFYKVVKYPGTSSDTQESRGDNLYQDTKVHPHSVFPLVLCSSVFSTCVHTRCLFRVFHVSPIPSCNGYLCRWHVLSTLCVNKGAFLVNIKTEPSRKKIVRILSKKSSTVIYDDLHYLEMILEEP